MTLNGIGNGNNWYNPSPGTSGASGVEKLEAEKKALQQELKRIKMQKNSETDQKAAMLKKTELERKIADIDQQIQKLRQEQQQGKNPSGGITQNNNRASKLQNQQGVQSKQNNEKAEDLNEQINKLVSKQIDTYV